MSSDEWGAHPSTSPRRRKPKLVIMIVVLAILYGLGAITNTKAWTVGHQIDPYWPNDLIESIIDTVAVIAIVGIWAWRRWAVYLLITVAGIEIIYELAVGFDPATPLTKLVVLAILLYTVFDQWTSFEPSHSIGPPAGAPTTPDRRRRVVYTALGVTVVVTMALVAAAIVGTGPSTAVHPTPALISTITAGAHPTAAALSPSGRQLYVSSIGIYQGGNGTVSVIDTVSNTVTASIVVARAPHGLVVTPDGRSIYVTSADTGPLPSNTVTATIAVGRDPESLAATPDGRRIYVTNSSVGETGNSVSVIDTASNTVTATIPVGRLPGGVAISPDGRFAYVPSINDGNMSVISTATNIVLGTILVGRAPNSVAVSPDGTHAYVTLTGGPDAPGDTLTVIDIARRTATKAITVASAPSEVTVSPDGRFAYVGSIGPDQTHPQSTLSVIDTASNEVAATIPTGQNPVHAVVTPDSRHAYVTNVGSRTDPGGVAVIDTGVN